VRTVKEPMKKSLEMTQESLMSQQAEEGLGTVAASKDVVLPLTKILGWGEERVSVPVRCP
jgi:hypothetical protein